MKDDRLEELARAIHDGLLGQYECRWDRLADCTKQEWRVHALAACEYFFGKDAKGEVVVPARGAVERAIGHIENIGRLNHPPRESDRQAALRALQGEPDENA